MSATINGLGDSSSANSAAFSIALPSKDEKKTLKDFDSALKVASDMDSDVDALLSDLKKGAPIDAIARDFDKLKSDANALESTFTNLKQSLQPSIGGMSPSSGSVISMWSVIGALEELFSSISNKLLVSQNQFAAFASSAGSNAATEMNKELNAIVEKINALTGGPDGSVSSDQSGTVTKLQMQYNTTQTKLQKPVTDFSSIQQLFTQLIQSTNSDLTQFVQMTNQSVSGFGDFLTQLARG